MASRTTVNFAKSICPRTVAGSIPRNLGLFPRVVATVRGVSTNPPAGPIRWRRNWTNDSLRGANHAGANWIQFDVALTGQQIVFGIDDARFESSLPQGARSSVDVIEISNVSATNALHHSGQAVVGSGGGQQVYMVGHEDPGVDRYTMLR